VKYKVVIFHPNKYLSSALPIQIVIIAREVASLLNCNLVTEYAIRKTELVRRVFKWMGCFSYRWTL